MTIPFSAPRPLPEGLEGLTDLALDLRWGSSPAAAHVWTMLDPDGWGRTENPWLILRDLPQLRLDEAAQDEALRGAIQAALDIRRRALDTPGWFAARHGDSSLRGVAYFNSSCYPVGVS